MTQISHTKEQQLGAIRDWKTIGVIKFKPFVEFKSCRHKGTLGTPDQLLCASCQMEKRRKEEKP